jgi:hypothetical protein
MLPALSIIAPLAKMLFATVDKAIPDKDLAEKLKAQLNTQLLLSSTEELKAAASIVEAEAKSNWFVASWRPLLMYVLIFILVWNYVLGPVIVLFTGTIITFELPGDVWTLLNVGLGGYVVGRSGESIARTLATKTGEKQSIMAKKWWNLKNEEEKNMSYSNIPDRSSRCGFYKRI